MVRTAVETENGKFLAVFYSTVLGRGPYIQSVYGQSISVLHVCVLESSIYKITRRKLALLPLSSTARLFREAPQQRRGYYLALVGNEVCPEKQSQGRKELVGKRRRRRIEKADIPFSSPASSHTALQTQKAPGIKGGKKKPLYACPLSKVVLIVFRDGKGERERAPFILAKSNVSKRGGLFPTYMNTVACMYILNFCSTASKLENTSFVSLRRMVNPPL